MSEYANQSLDKNYYEGMRIGEIWGFVSNGLWQDQASIDAAEAAAKAAGQSYYNPLMQTSKTYKLYPGDIKFEDLNGNGYIDRGQNTVDDPGDRKIIGNSTRRYQYGIHGGANWKGVSLSFLLQGVGKRDLWIMNDLFYPHYDAWTTVYDTQLNYWTPERTDSYLPPSV